MPKHSGKNNRAFNYLLVRENATQGKLGKKVKVSPEKNPEGFIQQVICTHLKEVKHSSFSPSIKKKKNHSDENKLFNKEFLSELTDIIIWTLVNKHQPVLIDASNTNQNSKQPEATLNSLLDNRVACLKLRESFKHVLWGFFQEKTSGKYNWSDEHLNNPSGKWDEWAKTKAKTLTVLFNSSAPALINTMHILAQEGDTATKARATTQAVLTEGKRREEEKAGNRFSLSNELLTTAEEEGYAEKIARYVIEKLPFALVTTDDVKSLIMLISKERTLEGVAENLADYIPLDDEDARVTKLLTSQNQDNMDAYLLYVLMRGGREKFCPQPEEGKEQNKKDIERCNTLDKIMEIRPEAKSFLELPEKMPAQEKIEEKKSSPKFSEKFKKTGSKINSKHSRKRSMSTPPRLASHSDELEKKRLSSDSTEKSL